MQRILIAAIAAVLMASQAYAEVEVQQHQGPYGLTALIIERDGRKYLGWKLPHQEAKLIFLGSIYDGKQDLTWKYGLKYLGQSRLKTDARGIERRTGNPGRPLYVFFDPNCDSCRMLYEKLEAQPIEDSHLIWVPICLDGEAFAKDQGIQWIMDAMPEARQKFELYDSTSGAYDQVTAENYQLLRWLKGGDEISVPCFVWAGKEGVEVRSGQDMADGKFEQVLTFLKGANR